MADKFGSMHLGGGALASDMGGTVLRGVPAGVTARQFGGRFDGLVLSVSTEQPTSRYDLRLGELACTRFLAASRIKLWWMIPSWGTRGQDMPPETQFLLLELGEGGPYAILLPLIDHGTFRSTLRPSGNKHGISLRIESGSPDVQSAQWSDAVLVGAGTDPFQLVQDAVVAAASLSGGAPALQDKRIPASVDAFGWCTWDAFYHKVSAAGIVQGLTSLEAAGVPPRLLIIDDGWQLTVPDEDDPTAAASPPRSVAPAEPKAAEVAAVEQSGGFMAWLVIKAVAAIEAFGDYAVQWPAGISFAQRVMRGPLRDIIRQHHLNCSEHAKRLSSVEANAKFSSLEAHEDVPWQSTAADLKGVVAQLKARFGLKFVFCWHAMHGYWSGVSPMLEPHKAVPVIPEPTPGVFEIDPAILWNPQTLIGIGTVDNVAALHRDMHTYLEGCGVDGVKVDVQGTSSMFPGGPRVSQQYHKSLEASVAQSFPGNLMINCMAHSTENLYRTTASAVTRVSDDFYPREPASHTVHLGVCAYNSLFIGPLLLPDWDMFHSQHPAASLHAAARAASGGPVYVSDAPSCHDGALLARLVLPDGSVLRAARPALPTRDTLFCDVLRDRRTLLKVWNLNQVNGLLFVANVQGASWDRRRRCFVTHDTAPPALQADVRPADVAALAASSEEPSSAGSERFAVYSERTRRLTLLDAMEAQQVELAAAQWDLLVVAPLQSAGDTCVAAIGLVNMLNAGGAVLSASASAGGGGGDGGASLSASLRGAGRMLVYASTRPARVALDGADVAFEYQPGEGAVRFDVPAAADLQTRLRVEF